MVDNYTFFYCMPVVQASDSMMAKAIHISWVGPELLVCCLVHRGSTGVFSFAPDFNKLFCAKGSPSSVNLLYL